MDQKTNLKKGVLFAFITSVISGLAIFYAKISLIKLPPLILTTTRNSYVGLLFVLYFLIFKQFNQLKKLQKKDWIYLFLIGLIGGSLPFYLFFSGLQMTNPLVGNLIHKTLFVWVTVMGYFFLKERFNLSYLISFVLIFIANFIIGDLKISFGKGELIIFLATLLWSVESIIAKKVLKSVSSEMVGLFRMGGGGATLLFISLITGKGKVFLAINPNYFIYILTGGSILFLYVYFWYKALKYAPAGLVTLILTFSVVVGNILNGAFAGVNLTMLDIYKSIIIATSVGLVLFSLFKFQNLKLKAATK